MDKYKQMTFEVKSQRILGWGEQSSNGQLFLVPGNYTLYPESKETWDGETN